MGLWFIEADLVTIGDFSFFDHISEVQTHTFVYNFVYKPMQCTALVSPATIIEDFGTLQDGALLLKGDTVPQGGWQLQWQFIFDGQLEDQTKIKTLNSTKKKGTTLCPRVRVHSQRTRISNNYFFCNSSLSYGSPFTAQQSTVTNSCASPSKGQWWHY